MESKVFNLGGDKPIQFILGIEQSTLVPSWIATIDEFWLLIVGNALYSAIKSHEFLCINKSLDDEKDFAATMNITSFNSLLLTGEAARFQDYVKAIMEFSLREHISPSPTMYISFISETSSHAVNAIMEFEKGIIMFGGNLGEKLSNLK